MLLRVVVFIGEWFAALWLQAEGETVVVALGSGVVSDSVVGDSLWLW